MDILGFTIRETKVADFDQLEELEKKVWTAFKTEVFTKHHFQAWVVTHPEGFLVAEKEDKIVGYVAYQKVIYDLELFLNTDYDTATQHGLTYETHNTRGDCFYVVSACSINPGAGFALISRGQALTKEQNLKCAVAFCRIPDFAEFFNQVQRVNMGMVLTLELEKELSLWYSVKTASKVNGKIRGLQEPKLQLVLPQSEKIDSVLGKVLRYPDVSLQGVSANYMKDPLSRNFAALTVFES